MPIDFGAADDLWPEGPFTARSYAGGTGGSPQPFITTRWEQQGKPFPVVTRFELWRDSIRVWSIQVHFSDGTRSEVFGRRIGNLEHRSLALAPGERIKTVRVRQNREYFSVVGQIVIETDAGQVLDSGHMSNNPDTPLLDLEVDSGILVGVAGRFGWYIDKIGFAFLRRPVTHIKVTNVTYTGNIIDTNAGIHTETLCAASFNSNETRDVNWSFAETITRSSSVVFDQHSARHFGAPTWEVVAPSIEIVTGQGGYVWGATGERAFDKSTSTTTSFPCSVSGVLPGVADYAITCEATAKHGTIKVPYTSTVTLYLDDDSTVAFPEKGVVSVEAWSPVSVEVR